ncbi:MAG: protocatechuate 3,4-dioxygenase subunit alpha [Casimicrobiaceae bacterium]
MSLLTTASQTVGPYLKIGFATLTFDTIAAKNVPGEHFVLQGRVFDGDAKAINDSSVEIWQANANGKYASPEDTQKKALAPGFRGYGRVLTDAAGAFRFATIKPGRVPGPGGVLQAPHLAVVIFMRGSLRHLLTRIYFADDPANAEDPILKLVPSERRTTLIARAAKPGVLEWDVHMQGPNETVFFDF